MIEWIVILTWVVWPFSNSFQKSIYESRFGDRIERVYISSDTKTFSNQWNALTVEERKNATVIKGQKYIVLPTLELTNGEKKECCEPLVKVGCVYRLKEGKGIVRITEIVSENSVFYGKKLGTWAEIEVYINQIEEEDLMKKI